MPIRKRPVPTARTTAKRLTFTIPEVPHIAKQVAELYLNRASLARAEGKEDVALRMERRAREILEPPNKD